MAFLATVVRSTAVGLWLSEAGPLWSGLLLSKAGPPWSGLLMSAYGCLKLDPCGLVYCCLLYTSPSPRDFG